MVLYTLLMAFEKMLGGCSSMPQIGQGVIVNLPSRNNDAIC